MRLSNRLNTIEAKLSPPRRKGFVVCDIHNEDEKIKEFILKHGRRPDRVVVVRVIAPDGDGGIKFVDEEPGK